MNLLSVENLSVEYRGKKQKSIGLEGVTWSVTPGERVAIMGPSGSGKSTLLSVLGGLLTPTSGDYKYKGASVTKMSARQLSEFRGREVGFVFQNSLLLPHLTLLENLLVPMEHVVEIKKSDAISRAMTLLDQMNIGCLADRFPKEISGGQGQRAAIARALMRNPSVVLADEPTGSLDEVSAKSTMEILQSLASSGTTVIVVTHNPAFVSLFDRSIRIDSGRIVENVDQQAAKCESSLTI